MDTSRYLIGVLSASAILLPFFFGQPVISKEKSELPPASEKDVFLYRGLGGSYLCNALVSEVVVRKAVGIAAATYVQVLEGKHGGIVESVGKEKLSREKLFAGAEFQIVTAAMQFCPDSVPEDVKEKVKKAIDTEIGKNKKNKKRK